MVENVKTINNIIAETINDYLRKNLLLASYNEHPRQVAHFCIDIQFCHLVSTVI